MAHTRGGLDAKPQPTRTRLQGLAVFPCHLLSPQAEVSTHARKHRCFKLKIPRTQVGPTLLLPHLACPQVAAGLNASHQSKVRLTASYTHHTEQCHPPLREAHVARCSKGWAG